MITVAILETIIDNIIEMNELFLEVAMGAGAAPLLVLVGGLLTMVAVGVFGVLALGAFASLLAPE